MNHQTEKFLARRSYETEVLGWLQLRRTIPSRKWPQPRKPKMLTDEEAQVLRELVEREFNNHYEQ